VFSFFIISRIGPFSKDSEKINYRNEIACNDAWLRQRWRELERSHAERARCDNAEFFYSNF
jgi:hypothetical protein